MRAVGRETKLFMLGVATIALHATIVRAVLLPATMKLLGKRSWLPKLEHEPEVVPAQT